MSSIMKDEESGVLQQKRPESPLLTATRGMGALLTPSVRSVNRKFIALFAACTLCIFFLAASSGSTIDALHPLPVHVSWRSGAKSFVSSESLALEQDNPDDFKDGVDSGVITKSALNSTLDFQEVFVISLPERHKRRDIISMMTDASDIKFQFTDGVRVPEDDKENYPIRKESITRAKLGCFRSHANVWRRMLTDNISTALILEDDADWDVGLRPQLQNLQTSLKQLIEKTPGVENPAERSVAEGYLAETAGSNGRIGANEDAWLSTHWDVLRVGICTDEAFKKDMPSGVYGNQVPTVFYDDVGVPPENKCWIEQDNLVKFYGNPLRTSAAESQQHAGLGKRLLVRSRSPVCLHAYALSRRGAAKLLLYQNKIKLGVANDLSVADATRNGFLISYSVLPTLFTQFKPLGGGLNSDIVQKHTDVTSKVLVEGAAEQPFKGIHACIINSTREALETIYPGAVWEI